MEDIVIAMYAIFITNVMWVIWACSHLYYHHRQGSGEKANE